MSDYNEALSKLHQRVVHLDDFLDRTKLDLYDLLRGKTGSHSQTARQLRTDRASLY
jgi:hypothetical protein